MHEKLLQFIWRFQYFNKNELVASGGEAIQVIFPGQYNTNQGPDFLNARIRIGNTMWAGNVELHIKTSDWKKHCHDLDENYKNVILHVVWEDDGHPLAAPPLIELKDRVSKILLNRYEELMKTSAFIPCEKLIHAVDDITWKSWQERLLVQRLTRKSTVVMEYLRQSAHHWEETFWWLLARSFGTIINADAFEAVARSLPLTLLAKNSQHILHLEALLLGQAALLHEETDDEYMKLLKKEYKFLQQKYTLKAVHTRPQFLRMRPGNFPTVRLAQLAMLVHTSKHLFSKMKETEAIEDLRKWFAITSAFKKKRLGSFMIDNIIINTIIPVLFAFGNYHGEERYKQKALQWLEETDGEMNTIIKRFEEIGITQSNAFDSQALIELKTQYCDHKKCLDCSVGNWLLRNMKM